MYPEFTLIYIGLGLMIILLVISIILLSILLKRSRAAPTKNSRLLKNLSPDPKGNKVVFCLKCAQQYPQDQTVCPHCGEPR